MDSMEINKAAAAVLVAGIAFMGASLISQALVSPTQLKTAAYSVAPAAGEAAPAAAAAAPPVEPIGQRLASASADKGKAAMGQQGCVACHTLNEGGKAGIGPNLWGVFGAKQGDHMEGYAYSAALKGKGGDWTPQALDEWLTKPAAYAPGTKMTFAGLADPAKRADIIAYLKSLGGK